MIGITTFEKLGWKMFVKKNKFKCECGIFFVEITSKLNFKSKQTVEVVNDRSQVSNGVFECTDKIFLYVQNLTTERLYPCLDQAVFCNSAIYTTLTDNCALMQQCTQIKFILFFYTPRAFF